MRVQILTPLGTAFDDKAFQVILPGFDGEFAILDMHQDCLASLAAGQVRIQRYLPDTKDGIKETVFAVSRGVVKIHLNEVVIMAEPG